MLGVFIYDGVAPSNVLTGFAKEQCKGSAIYFQITEALKGDIPTVGYYFTDCKDLSIVAKAVASGAPSSMLFDLSSIIGCGAVNADGEQCGEEGKHRMKGLHLCNLHHTQHLLKIKETEDALMKEFDNLSEVLGQVADCNFFDYE